MMKIIVRGGYSRNLLLAMGLLTISISAQSQSGLTLSKAIQVAQQNDPWMDRSRNLQEVMQARSTASAELPDPNVSLGLLNLPSDTFDTSQEPTTQVKVSISQMFPRGASRELSQKLHESMSREEPFLRENRRAQLNVNVAVVWLDAYLARETIALIESNRVLFEHLVDVSESSYASAYGKTRQQDIVRAQLELTLLEDRLVVLGERYDVAMSRLTEWVGFQNNYDLDIDTGFLELSPELPELHLVSDMVLQHELDEQAMMTNYFVRHPLIKALDQKLAASQTKIELSRQKYKPRWGINASYGYRDDDRVERPDFLSVGVMFDLPLFHANRQDQDVKAAVATSEVTRADRILALRNMYASYRTAKSRLLRLEDRQELYQRRLLAEMMEQAEASLTAYTRDDGDFSEVMRARISELNARIDALVIDVQRLQSIVRLNYYLVQSTSGVSSNVE